MDEVFSAVEDDQPEPEKELSPANQEGDSVQDEEMPNQFPFGVAAASLVADTNDRLGKHQPPPGI